MDKEISFLGVTFTIPIFLLLALAWTISLLFVWPYFLYVHATVYFGCTIGAMLFSGFINRKLLLLILLVFYINKNIVIWFQNCMLVLSGFLATLVYCLIAHKGFWMFISQFLIVTFSVFVYYTLVIRVMAVNED